MRSPAWRRLRTALALLIALAAGSCAVREPPRPPAPGLAAETPWPVVIAHAKAFMYGLGFRSTDNFMRFDADQPSFPHCGRAPMRVLPWSYEDPVIEWEALPSEAQCRAASGPGIEVYHGESEALGEIGTPVTASMLAAGIARMVYLVVHEDCHDQFDLPYGIEEPLCEVLSYRAMLAMAGAPGPFTPAEREAIRNHARSKMALMPVTVRHYEAAAALHARHARGELPEAALLRERVEVFARADAALGLPAGSLGGIALASRMTYARHYAEIERMLERLGGDLGRLVALFRQVDEAMAGAEDVGPGSRRTEAAADKAATARPGAAPSGDRRTAAPRPPPLRDPRAAGTKPAPPAAAAATKTTTRPPAHATAGVRGAAGDTSPDRGEPAVRLHAAERAILDTATRFLGIAETAPAALKPPSM